MKYTFKYLIRGTQRRGNFFFFFFFFYNYQSNHSTESPLIFKVINMMKCKYMYGFSDIDECKGNHPCHVSATCTNTNGSYLCECHPGFNGNGQICTGEFDLLVMIFRIFLLESNLKLLRWPYY